MPEPSNQASLQRRANWVGLRTLRQRPKLVGATSGGEPIYEVRSVRLVLRGLSPHFDRLAPCSRCAKEVPASPVLTIADVERTLRPVICSACVRDTGVSTVWETPAAAVELEGAEAVPTVAVEPAPVAVAESTGRAGVEETLEVFERHLRAVTDRVNEFGMHLWAQQAASDERRDREAAAQAALTQLGDQVALVAGVGSQVEAQRAEVAAVLSAITDIRSELQRLSESEQELARADQDLAQRVAVVPAAVATPEELARVASAQEELARAHGQLARRLAEVEPPPPPPQVDLAPIRREVVGRLAEIESRLGERVATQRGEIEAAVHAYLATHGSGVFRAHQELSENQAVLLQRLDAVAGQLAQLTGRMDALASWAASTNERLEVLEERAERALLAASLWEPAAEPSRSPAPTGGGLLDTLERQLHAASNRLAAGTGQAPTES